MTAHVLVTDGEQRSALAACRALAAAGYRVSTLACSRVAVAHWSRCSHQRVSGPDPRLGLSSYAERLSEILSQRTHELLLPGSDASLIAVSEHRDLIEAHVRTGLPDRAVVERALDKLALLGAAEAAGLGPPATVVCESAAVARRHARDLGFPLIVKPARSFLRDGDRLRQQSARVASSELDLQNLDEFGTPFLLQRYESAPVVSCSGVIDANRLLAFAVARYVRTWPVAAGPSCSSVTIEPPAGLRNRIERLVQAIGWRGIFQVQLLELDGGPATLDFNARIFGSLELAVAAGANLPAVWANVVRGGDVEPVVARPGVRYRWEEGDAHHVLGELRRGRFGSAAAVLTPHRRVAHAYFRARDPAPLAAAVAAAVVRRRRRRDA
jgi:predicted ATP-grasp superfamily ATP-dependent carboligase